MSKENREKVHLIYGIVLSALIVLLGACLAVSCVSIYKSGDRPFNTASIADAFMKISIPTLLCGVGIIGGIVVSVVFPLEDGKERPSPDKRATVKKLREKLASYGGGSYEAEKIASRRGLVGILCALLCIFSAIPVLIHLFNFSNFTSDINGSVISLALVLLPCAVLAFAVGVFYSFYAKYNYNKEISELKKALAASVNTDAAMKPVLVTSKPKATRLFIVRIAVFSVAAAFIVLGILNGGMRDVLDKAIKICTECIGLG